MQFSDSPSAANGGNLGWVNKGKLASPLETALNKMSSGDISEPILVGDGYYILKLQKTFDPQKDKPELPDENKSVPFWKIKKWKSFPKSFCRNFAKKP